MWIYILYWLLKLSAGKIPSTRHFYLVLRQASGYLGLFLCLLSELVCFCRWQFPVSSFQSFECFGTTRTGTVISGVSAVLTLFNFSDRDEGADYAKLEENVINMRPSCSHPHCAFLNKS